MQGISTIHCDIWGSYWVSFLDGTARKYTPTLSSYLNLTFTDPIQQFTHFRFFQGGIPLSNGTNFLMNSQIIATLIKNRTKIQVYHYNNLSLIDSYEIGQEIVSFWGFPMSYQTNINQFLVINNHESIQFCFKKKTYTVLAFNSTIGAGVTLLQDHFDKYTYNYQTNSINFTFEYYVSFSNKDFYHISVSFKFVFNYSTSSYDLSFYSSSYYLVATTPFTVDIMKNLQNYLVLQNNATGWLGFFDKNRVRMGYVDPNIPRD